MSTLFVVATPIGNRADITIRATDVLRQVPVIACEDTRHTGQFVKYLEDTYGKVRTAPVRYISVRDWNEAETVGKLILELAAGHDVALASDAGTPLISDPGYKVVKAIRQAGFTVSPLPGASASLAALSVSGLPTNKFVFLGFWQKKFELTPGSTAIIYESPTRAQATLHELKNRYPTAEIMIARELTKIHEYIGPDDGIYKGEITILAYLPQ